MDVSEANQMRSNKSHRDDIDEIALRKFAVDAAVERIRTYRLVISGAKRLAAERQIRAITARREIIAQEGAANET